MEYNGHYAEIALFKINFFTEVILSILDVPKTLSVKREYRFSLMAMYET